MQASSGAPLMALTGATGFLGRHLAVALAARGVRLRLLIRERSAHPLWTDLKAELVPGDLDDADSLSTLVRGADSVIHAAGLIKARSRHEFLRVNRDGSARLAAAVQRASPRAHLIGISSLAARAPFVSAYAHSKRSGEAALREAFSGRLTILRPPVIYGPWDRETLSFFRAVARRIALLPESPAQRIAMIHVADAVASIVAAATWIDAPGGTIHALADTNPAGYSPREIIGLAASALGTRPPLVRLPKSAVLLVGHMSELSAMLRGRPAMFSAGKAREMLYPDWSVTIKELLPATLHQGKIDLRSGFSSTVAWYRQAGWLASSNRGHLAPG